MQSPRKHTGRQRSDNNPAESPPRREFHIRADVRRRLRFDDTLFSLTADVIRTDFTAVRQLADRLNRDRSAQQPPGKPVNAGELNALGLLDELMHLLIVHYLQEVDESLFTRLHDRLQQQYDQVEPTAVLTAFASDFPPAAIYQGRLPVDEWLRQQTGATPHPLLALEELLLLRLDNENPACGSLRELVDDRELRRDTEYDNVIQSLEQFFDQQPGFGPGGKTLLEMLREPAQVAPDSLAGQLRFIQANWNFLGEEWHDLLLRALDFVREEEKLFRHGRPGPVTARAWLPEHGELEPERFSRDSDWMPRVVMQAKSAFVWLEQLSREYGYHVARLDQVPDAELDQLAARGITALWLIGVWERSPASRRIKQLMGDGEALASAYSLFNYRIAEQLGGEEALANLSHRAGERGIRLAGDMVPNHTGIDSEWIRHHPERFVQLAEPPYYNYSFSGENLSGDERLEIQLEDGYRRRDDASVVFRRRERDTGRVSYIYHGNDGTQMPWNDTAQLDLLLPDVREAIIQEILSVARRFPLIRFDAAMTLARRHFQRLWYPAPGSGGDIPSRAERGLNQAEFNQRFPQEFWREVVDRVEAEVPGTLLLAEAFWLMEGFFVRTLGMHRVYNSAFMHMLRDEENGKYRAALKQTLAWDARILERYVNFMNNPDEESAVEQFGRDDKYIGVCILLATLPGLPMLGHGQLEGLREKYGMEFHRPRSGEQPDRELMARHERLLYPLLHRRYLFAEVQNFQLYDLHRADGSVDEDVYAYSNRRNGEQALVVYHNRYTETAGRIHTGTTVKPAGGESYQPDLVTALGLEAAGCYRFRDHCSGLEYLRTCGELQEQGLQLRLHAYACHLFLDWQAVPDSDEQPWSLLEQRLDGRGVPSLDRELLLLRREPLRQELQDLLVALREEDWFTDGTPVEGRIAALYHAGLTSLTQAAADAGLQLVLPREGADDATDLPSRFDWLLQPVGGASTIDWAVWVRDTFTAEGEPLAGRLLLMTLAWLHGMRSRFNAGEDCLAEWGLTESLPGELIPAAVPGDGEERQRLLSALLEISTGLCDTQPDTRLEEISPLLERALALYQVRIYLEVNEHDGVTWFNRELYHNLLNWLPFANYLATGEPAPETLTATAASITRLRKLGKRSGYCLDELLQLLRS